jgi:hypothetical protein
MSGWFDCARCGQRRPVQGRRPSGDICSVCVARGDAWGAAMGAREKSRRKDRSDPELRRRRPRKDREEQEEAYTGGRGDLGWEWSWNPLIGIMYGPIPVGLIILFVGGLIGVFPFVFGRGGANGPVANVAPAGMGPGAGPVQPPLIGGPPPPRPPAQNPPVQNPPGQNLPGQNPPAQNPPFPGPQQPAQEPPFPVQPVARPCKTTDVALPGPVADAAVGGGGRYLVLRLAAQGKLVLFDVEQGVLAGEIPLPDGIVHFAAGAREVVVLAPSTGLLEVWDLASAKKQRSGQLPPALARSEIGHVCMGSASTGPLFVYLPKEKMTAAMDPATGLLGEVKWTHWGPRNAYGPLQMRASPDGSLLVGWGGGWAGAEATVIKNGRQVAVSDRMEFVLGEFALPSADASLIFTPFAVVSCRDYSAAKLPQLKDAYLVPAHEPGAFVALYPAVPPRSALQPGLAVRPVRQVVVYREDGTAVFTLEDGEWRKGSPMPWEKCVHYFPGRQLLVTPAGDSVRLRRFE